jgi:hypothetical protein
MARLTNLAKCGLMIAMALKPFKVPKLLSHKSQGCSGSACSATVFLVSVSDGIASSVVSFSVSLSNIYFCKVAFQKCATYVA